MHPSKISFIAAVAAATSCCAKAVPSIRTESGVGQQHQLRLLKTSATTPSSKSSAKITLTSTELGEPDSHAAIGSPMRGIVESPLYSLPTDTHPYYNADIPLALEFYYIGLDEVMFGNPDVVREDVAFNWTVIDTYLEGSASRSMHAILRVMLHFPYASDHEIKIPQYLLGDVMFHATIEGSSPDYSHDGILEALQQFVIAFGKRYDGDNRIAFIQTGLLGFWGEWHIGGENDEILPESTKELIIQSYASAFTKTRIQTRYARKDAYDNGIGLHDDSFGFHTLDGDANGGIDHEQYFWPSVERTGVTDSWSTTPMGGETRIRLQEQIFEKSYESRSFEKQDFMECVEVTHASYILHHEAFKDGGFSGTELENAQHAHAHLGYNYYVSIVTASSSSDSESINVDLTMEQIGNAPFYYPLSLSLHCDGMSPISLGGVESMAEKNSACTFHFENVPATPECLQMLRLSLDSDILYNNRPILFAQNDGTVEFSLLTDDSSISNSDVEIKPSMFTNLVQIVIDFIFQK